MFWSNNYKLETFYKKITATYNYMNYINKYGKIIVKILSIYQLFVILLPPMCECRGVLNDPTRTS